MWRAAKERGEKGELSFIPLLCSPAASPFMGILLASSINLNCHKTREHITNLTTPPHRFLSSQMVTDEEGAAAKRKWHGEGTEGS